MHFHSFMGQILRVVAQKVDNMITIIFISVGKKEKSVWNLFTCGWQLVSSVFRMADWQYASITTKLLYTNNSSNSNNINNDNNNDNKNDNLSTFFRSSWRRSKQNSHWRISKHDTMTSSNSRTAYENCTTCSWIWPCSSKVRCVNAQHAR